MDDGTISGSEFYTLSSNQTSQGNMNNINSSMFVPPPATHDTSRSNCHLKNLSTRAFPNLTRAASRYTSVQALILRWEQDDLHVDPELEDLMRVFKKYGFLTTKWLIPTQNAHRKLMLKVGEFVDAYDQKECLMIVYYGGHAYINEARQSTWSCSRSRTYSTLDWSAVQTLFESALSDVLLLLDCCAAASSAPKGGTAMTETIAACGWESIAAEPGRFSFTTALIEVLEEWINRRFSVAMLHSRILSILKHERPELLGGTRRVECRTTPVYIVTTDDPELPSIILNRMKSVSRTIESGVTEKRKREVDPETKILGDKPTRRSKRTKVQVESLNPHYDRMDGVQNDSIVSTDSDDMSQRNNPTPLLSPPSDYSANGEPLLGNDSDGVLKIPHVLISLALEEDQMVDFQTCSEWLASFPALAKWVKVEGIYRSYSTLLIMSIPVFIWDLLPDNQACSLIGYVRTGNILSEKYESANKRVVTNAITSTSEDFTSETGGRRPAPIESRDQVNTPSQISRSSSVARSLSIRRSMSPVTGNALRLPGDPISFTHLSQTSVPTKGDMSVNNTKYSLPWQRQQSPSVASSTPGPPAKKSRTNTPWTTAEETRLKTMRDAGNSWADIAKTFPSRTEGSVKKHWYKDMHYAEFAEDESQALLNAIKEYEVNKWKVIGHKVGKPAKVDLTLSFSSSKGIQG
ncbi:uncharacterized protein PAC_18617 [Phialocephala subalpina]|uniref:Myb-like domain-containing protein n=1 Tax=Phialocephala subalpina TaxID=576137 RepID=A0A1L7XUK9_9HELO|nr:uncharacterized protein PAC_18617 [Phialocephala subalpina]